MSNEISPTQRIVRKTILFSLIIGAFYLAAHPFIFLKEPETDLAQGIISLYSMKWAKGWILIPALLFLMVSVPIIIIVSSKNDVPRKWRLSITSAVFLYFLTINLIGPNKTVELSRNHITFLNPDQSENFHIVLEHVKDYHWDKRIVHDDEGYMEYTLLLIETQSETIDVSKYQGELDPMLYKLKKIIARNRQLTFLRNEYEGQDYEEMRKKENEILAPFPWTEL